MSHEATIRYVMQAKKKLSFVYTDEEGNEKRRTVEPFCYGKNHLGNTLLRAWDEDAEPADSGLKWRLFDTSQMKKVTDVPARRQLRPQYNASGDEALTNRIYWYDEQFKFKSQGR